MTFIQARNYKVGRDGKQIRLLVCHDMEAPEGPLTAENVARYFAAKDTRMASAHYCVDNNSVVQCVKDSDTAYAAKGANADGLHFELAGYARQTPAEWVDSYSLPMLTLAAALVAAKARAYGIPVRKLTAAEVRAGKAGICGHGDVTKAYPPGTGHTDPGGQFPWPLFLDLIQKHTVTDHGGGKGTSAPITPTTGEWDEMATKDEIRALIAEELAKAKLATHQDIVVLLRGTADGQHPENLTNIYNNTKPER